MYTNQDILYRFAAVQLSAGFSLGRINCLQSGWYGAVCGFVLYTEVII